MEDAPPRHENPQTGEQNKVPEEHRDHHAHLTEAQQRGPKAGIKIGLIDAEEPYEQVDGCLLYTSRCV